MTRRRVVPFMRNSAALRVMRLRSLGLQSGAWQPVVRKRMVLSSSQMSEVGGMLVVTGTSCAAGERWGVAASVTVQSPISSVRG